ncbi:MULTISPECIES: salicylate synthase [unclassified Rhizobium]|uniref:salicylate synthase n=1 Tax=unclassified Rhizobium TaxID=2613769 RepID=UPI001ADD1489|nr:MULTISPECIES: salicylate synthase [unclassified Rhizobium]MBO9101950.1 salicylate synthase [Rhizobium sp. L58/93]MBO9172121.1 salicylate synthase [Rhizobium sp. L245/93]QXZ88336.1 salicylate synthase [Rhizobium sp. K1/93]QXZ94307.1 salicylate synthase [Rhizobium sp. K15/93]QYA05802.1 salicylate synthase [Rhizobium sp. B21/90]
MTLITSGIAQPGTTRMVPLTVDIFTAAGALARAVDGSVSHVPERRQDGTGAEPQPYILYEKAGEIVFAAGCATEIRLDRAGLHLTTPAGSRTEPLTDRPLHQVRAMVASVLSHNKGEQLRIFGWAAFELSYLLQSLPIGDHAGTLLYLVLPQHEARIRAGEAKLVVSDPDIADLWEAALREARPEEPAKIVQVDEISDTSGYVDAARGAIRSIDGIRLRKVILSRRVSVSQDIDLVASYQMLRRHNTPARSFLLRLGGIAAAGVSPGAIIEVSATGAIVAQPLAGTRAWTGQPERDAALREELLCDPKEIYEHALSVKLAQDEIAEVSEPGTVFVEDFMAVVARGSVQHLASRVRGQLRKDASCWDAFGSVFPAVTASGIPKRDACREIGLREDTPRGLYSGAVLSIDIQGGLDAALVLRSVYQAGGTTWLRAGAGLVSQSDPERELEETREKMRSVSRFLVARAGSVA